MSNLKILPSFVVFLLSLIVLGLSTATGTNAKYSSEINLNKRVLLITIDGLRPNFYLDERYSAPTLKKMRDEGAYADGVEVVFPTLTYPSHTSLVTGVYPAQHGILSNTLFSWENGPSVAWYWEADKIKSPTIYEYIRRAGGTSASVRWPVTIGETQVDYLVPEIFSSKGFYEGDNFDLTAKYTRPELMKEILENIQLKRYDNDVQMDNWVAQASAYILKNKKPNFMNLHLANVDHVEHGYGPNGDEVVEAVKLVDAQVKTILDAVDLNETCVIVTGDHGFLDVAKKLSPNVLFIEKGWIQLDKKGNLQDWQVIAHASGAQAAIYVKNKELLSAVEKLLAEKSTVGFNIVSKSDLKKMNTYPDADLAIEGQPGYTISGSLKGELVSSSGSVRGQHGFLPTRPELRTGLLTLGCGFAKGKRWQLAHQIDIAPTIAKIMGFQAETFVGKPLQ